MEQELKKYLDIVSYVDGSIVKRFDVSGKSEREIDKIESGMNRNLNHEEFYTSSYESYLEKQPID